MFGYPAPKKSGRGLVEMARLLHFGEGSNFSKESFGRDFSSVTTRNKLNLMLINDTSAVSLVFYFISIRSTTIRLLHYVPTAPIYWRRPSYHWRKSFLTKASARKSSIICWFYPAQLTRVCGLSVLFQSE